MTTKPAPLEQLRIFVAVAERQHVTEAARALNLAQSAASHAIASLEARHDTKLFDRIGRRIVLTEAGQALLAEARSILAQVERAEQTLGEFGRLERGGADDEDELVPGDRAAHENRALDRALDKAKLGGAGLDCLGRLRRVADLEPNVSEDWRVRRSDAINKTIAQYD